MAYAPFDLSGHVALITGGNRGIGLGMARALAAANANIAVWGRKTEQNEAAVETLARLGNGTVAAWSVDMSEEEAIVSTMEEVLGYFKRIDSCFANAGAGFSAPAFTEMDTETWHKNLKVNLDGSFWTMREAAKHMVQRAQTGDPGGSIVGIASLAATEGAARNQAYAASKGGIISLVKGIAVEHARHGIRANAILPGWIATDLTQAAQDSDVFNSKVISRVPARRWGEPADFGGIAVYLASSASSYHSGDLLVVDGAYSIF